MVGKTNFFDSTKSYFKSISLMALKLICPHDIGRPEGFSVTLKLSICEAAAAASF